MTGKCLIILRQAPWSLCGNNERKGGANVCSRLYNNILNSIVDKRHGWATSLECTSLCGVKERISTESPPLDACARGRCLADRYISCRKIIEAQRKLYERMIAMAHIFPPQSAHHQTQYLTIYSSIIYSIYNSDRRARRHITGCSCRRGANIRNP